MKSSPLHIPGAIVEETLAFLRAAGDRHSEGVVLWLGQRQETRVAVIEAFVPQQQAANDYFRIPPRGMSALLAHLRETRSFIAAQVHSHPREAFHSHADDRWAIVRHAGALSLVVPYFAQQTSRTEFLDQIAAFQLSEANEWRELNAAERRMLITLV